MNRAVNRLDDEVGFKNTNYESIPRLAGGSKTVEEFARTPMDADELELALSMIKEECPSLVYDTYPLSHKPIIGRDKSPQMHRLRLAGESGGWTIDLGLVPINSDTRLEQPSATIMLIRSHEPSLWQRLTAWLPFR